MMLMMIMMIIMILMNMYNDVAFGFKTPTFFVNATLTMKNLNRSNRESKQT